MTSAPTTARAYLHIICRNKVAHPVQLLPERDPEGVAVPRMWHREHVPQNTADRQKNHRSHLARGMKKFTISVGVAIVLFLAYPFLFGKEIAATVTPPSALSQKDLLEVKVYRLIVDPGSMQPVVLIVDQSGERVMPIWIGANEAVAIQMELEGTKAPRPMTHDLLGRVIQQLKATVRRVIITQEKEGIYHAVLVLEKDRTLIEIDARPSDSLAMALKFNVPILIPRSLFQAKAVLLLDQKNVEATYGLSIQEVTPELAESFSFKEARGVLIADVREGSRAEKDGIQRGDILVEIGGEKVKDVPTLRSALAGVKGSAKVKIFRKGSFVTVTLNPAD